MLLLQRQARAAETRLSGDFRVLLFLESDLPQAKQELVAQRLRRLPDVADVRVVTRRQELAQLESEEPGLAESVALVGGNPLMPALEVKLTEAGLGHVPLWIAHADALASFSDVRYKPAQVRAILQARFYARFLDLVLAALAFGVALLALIVLGPWAGGAGAWRAQPGGVAALAAGAACGMLAVAALMLPLSLLASWWQWPQLPRQMGLLAAAVAAGWALCRR